MSCTGDASDIGLWATGLWTTLGQPSDVSALTISGWASQSFTVGALNAYTNQCYSGISGAYVCPDLNQADFAILGAMYAVQFYNFRAQAMAGAGGVEKTWTELRDGDSVMRRSSPGELMKAYVAMANEAAKTLRNLVAFYNDYLQNGTLPHSVLYPTVIQNVGGVGGWAGSAYTPYAYYRS